MCQKLSYNSTVAQTKMNFVRFTQVNVKNVVDAKNDIKKLIKRPELPELRRAKFPLRQVIELELCEEQLYLNFYKNLLKLAEEDENLKSFAENEQVLNVIQVGLRNTVTDGKVTALLDLAGDLTTLRYEWVANIVYLKALATAEVGQQKALCHYLYAKFLFYVRTLTYSLFVPKQEKYMVQKLDESGREIELALEEFAMLRDEDDVFNEKLLLLKINVLEEKSILLQDTKFTDMAIELVALMANKKTESEQSNIFSKLTYTKARILKRKEEIPEAINTFKIGIEHAVKAMNHYSHCEGHFELAMIYLALDDTANHERYVCNLKELASKYNEDKWLTEALLMSGTISLSTKKYHDAIAHGIEAKKLAVATNAKNLVKAREILAIGMGNLMLPNFLEEVKRAHEANQHLFNILNWKICRNFVNV